DGVVADGKLLLELRPADPLLEVGEACGRVRRIGLGGDAVHFPVRFGFGVADDAVAGDAEDEWRKIGVLCAALFHVGDLGGNGGGIVAVHEVGVALGGDEVLGSLGLTAGVERGASEALGCAGVGAPRHGLGREDVVVDV